MLQHRGNAGGPMSCLVSSCYKAVRGGRAPQSQSPSWSSRSSVSHRFLARIASRMVGQPERGCSSVLHGVRTRVGEPTSMMDCSLTLPRTTCPYFSGAVLGMSGLQAVTHQPPGHRPRQVHCIYSASWSKVSALPGSSLHLPSAPAREAQCQGCSKHAWMPPLMRLDGPLTMCPHLVGPGGGSSKQVPASGDI